MVILRHTRCSVCNIVVAFIYMERIKQDYPGLELSSNNMQRILLVAVMIATKHFDDFRVSNSRWGLIGELSLEEMNSLELKFLGMINFNCNIQREEYDTFVEAIDVCPRLLRDSTSADRLIQPLLPVHNSQWQLSFSYKYAGRRSSAYSASGSGEEVVNRIFLEHGAQKTSPRSRMAVDFSEGPPRRRTRDIRPPLYRF